MQEEMTITQMLLLVLRKWRVVIITMLAFALLMGGYKGFTGMRARSDAAASDAGKESYEAAAAEYQNAKTALEDRINDAKAELEKETFYLENSELMHLDYLALDVCQINVLVSSEKESLIESVGKETDMPGKIELAYFSYVNSSDLYELLNDRLETSLEARFWKELFSVTYSGAGVIQIRSIANETDRAQMIADTVYDYLASKTEQLSSTIEYHTFQKLNETLSSEIDESLPASRKSHTDRIAALENSVANNENALSELEMPAAEINDNGAFGLGTILKSTIKYAVLGLLVGLFVSAMLIWLLASMNPKIDGTDGLREVFKLKMLGMIPPAKKKNRIDAWVDGLDSVIVKGLSSETALDMLKTNIILSLQTPKVQEQTQDNAAADMSSRDALSVLCVGGMSDSDTEAVIDRLLPLCAESGITLIKDGDVLRSAEALHDLHSCGRAILFAKRGKTKYSDVEKQLVAITDAGAEVIGAVLVG